MSLRAALVGCGRIGSEYAEDPRVTGIYSHAGAYSVSQAARLAGVCDLDPARAQKCAQLWKLPRSYTDLGEMLAVVRPEIVSICTPDATHASVLRQVLTCPEVRGVLMEKPLAQSTDEAREILARAAERGVRIAVNYIRRYASGLLRVRERIAAGLIGQVQNVTGLYTGGLVHNGSHWIDLVRWWVGEIAEVHGFQVPGDTSRDPSHDVRFVFANGARGMLQSARAEQYAVFEADIVGTAGRVRLFDLGHKVALYKVADSPYYSGYRNLVLDGEEPGGLDQAMSHAVEDLLTCVRSGGTPRCSGHDGLMALQIALCAQRSAEMGEAVGIAQS